MIKDLMYEDYRTLDGGDTILTKYIYYASDPEWLQTIETPDFTPAYWLGWVSWDDLPTSAHVSRAELTDDALIFTDVTRRENIDFLYDTPFTTSSSPATAYQCNGYSRYREDLDPSRWMRASLSTNATPLVDRTISLYNKLDVNRYLCNNVKLQFHVAGKDTSTGTFFGYYMAELSIVDLMDGAFSVSATLSVLGGIAPPEAARTITITQDDLTGEIITKTIDTTTIKIVCEWYGIAGWFRPISTYYQWPLPTFHIHDEDGNAYMIGLHYAGVGEQNGSWRTGAAVVVSSSGAIDTTWSPVDQLSGIVFGGYVGSVSRDLLAEINTIADGRDMVDIPGANFSLACNERSNAIRLIRKFTLAEIQKTMGFQIRVGAASTSNTYDNGEDKYYPLVIGNQFMGELINGESDRDRLQPWQLVGNQVDGDTNEYKESDKPIYIPPDPDDADKIGDSIGFNRTFPSGSATGLFTLYALRQSHVSQLGAKLWATMGAQDQNFWQNVQFAIGTFAETGSADISSILEYITSIRIYPFALINLQGYTTTGSGAIRLGTGKIPLDLSSGGAGNVGIMGQYTGIIDAGSAYIPEHFEDFRDLEDVTISVYLPYIGNIQLNPAEVTGCTIAAEYAVDLTSGSCVAYLLLSGRWGYYPIGVYNGTIGADIPLSASQGNRLFLRELSMALGISSIFGNGVFGSAKNSGDDAQFMRGVGGATAAAAAYGINAALAQAAGAALTPPTLGSAANFAGFGAPQTAYLQIRRAQYAYTARSFPAATYGNRTAQRATIGALSGFTRCINPDVSKIPAPAAIQRSIKAKLEAGVYI